MDLGSLFLIIAIALLAGIWIIRPFFQPQAGEALVVDTALHPDIVIRRNLIAERERILAAIQELDSDSALGKIAPNEYTTQRNHLLVTGASVLQRLETVESTLPPQDTSLFSPTEDSALTERLAARRAARQEPAAGFCPQCGRPVQQSDRFCARCGKTLS